MIKVIRKIFQSCKSLIWGFRQLFIAAPYETSVLFFFIIFQGLIPASSLYAIQGIIQWISESTIFPVFFVTLWGGMLFADIVLTPVIAVVRLHLNEKMLSHCNILLMEKANTIQGLEPFENAKFYDEIQFLKNESSRRPLNFVYVLTGFMKEGVALLAVITVLSSLEWWIPMGMLIASLPHAFSTLWFEKQSWDQMLFRSPESRKLAWISSVTLDAHVAKEVRLFGFGDFLIGRYKELMQNMHQALSKERWKKSAFSVFLSSLTILGNILIISTVLLKAKQGFLQIGSLVIAIQALVMTQSQLSGCISYIGMTTPILLFFEKLRSFLSNSLCSLSNLKPAQTSDFFYEIRFEDVSFSYPDGRNALSNVSFTIQNGEKIALVGENGAGKSTLIKLLLRFYDPSKGRITIDGKDLKSLDVATWRSIISGVFQDFGQYHFTVGENVALGDVKASLDRISHALHQGGFSTVLPKLPAGFNALLGKEFGGTTLSGGEWQKLAMSRAFFREAKLLIFDEPTAALDPKSEHEIFKTFAEQAQGKTVLLITHRLGSIKMVNRILVLKNGQLIEEGTHQNLLQKEGEYANFFKTQATQYENSLNGVENYKAE